MCLNFFCNKKYLVVDQAYMDYDYDVVLIAGQSNAEGYGRGDEQLKYIPHDPIYGYTEHKGVHLACDKRYKRRDVAAAFCLYFGEAYCASGLLQPGRKLLLLNTAVGGTGFTDHRWGEGADLSSRMHRLTREVLSWNPRNRVVAFLWHQGETDAINKLQGKHYAMELKNLVAGTRLAFKLDGVPFIAGNMSPEWMRENPEAYEIAAHTKALTKELPMSAYVESDGLSGNAAPDTIHFSRKSCVELGKRYFQKYRELLMNHDMLEAKTAKDG